jgi:predicted small lipoprotein YifL
VRAIAAVTRFAVQACLAASLLGGALALAGCGQKGPLYLPDREASEVQPPAPQPPTEPASEDTTKKKEEPR